MKKIDTAIIEWIKNLMRMHAGNDKSIAILIAIQLEIMLHLFQLTIIFQSVMQAEIGFRGINPPVKWISSVI